MDLGWVLAWDELDWIALKLGWVCSLELSRIWLGFIFLSVATKALQIYQAWLVLRE